MSRVLVVDDSRSVHAFVRGILSGKDFELEHVYNGQESLQRLENKKLPKIDLILMDWEMPTMTGPEAISAIMAKGETVPIVMMTSKNDPSDLARMLEAGVEEYIMKPFTHDILLGRLGDVLEKRK
jgi:two-component system chemotaxis response regulator CheY